MGSENIVETVSKKYRDITGARIRTTIDYVIIDPEYNSLDDIKQSLYQKERQRVRFRNNKRRGK